MISTSLIITSFNPSKISNTGFYNSVAEDSLNIVHSNFTLDNVTINKSVSDGFDSDFSTGVIKNSKFSNIGGDALDFSGSYTNIENCAFKNVYDKAVSSGESSNVHVEYLNIDNVGVGIASKDGSETTGSNVNISNYKMSALMTYVKKPFYGKPKLDLNNVVVDNKLNAYIRQKETTMSVNKVEVEEKRMNIKKMYKSGVMKK